MEGKDPILERPYELPDGTRITIAGLLDKGFIEKLIDDRVFRIIFVMGSGRMPGAAHPALVSDALFFPEISVELYKVIEGYGYEYEAKSALDIDLEADENLLKENMLISGGPLVNSITRRLMERYGAYLKICFPPESGGIKVRHRKQEKTLWEGYEDAGFLSIMKNPWASDEGIPRIVILCAGNYPVGTVASLRFLLDLIKDPLKREDAKIDGDEVPAHIVKGQKRKYREPQPELHNIESYEVITEKVIKWIESRR